MSKLAPYLFLTLVLFCETNAYKMLIVFPLPIKSHAILGDAVVEHLSKAGHQVTYITAFAPDQTIPNVTVIDISESFTDVISNGHFKIKEVMDKPDNSQSLYHFMPMLSNMTKVSIENPKVQMLIADKSQQFDVVIAEWMLTEIYAGFAGVFDCPLIWFSTVQPHWMTLQLIDEIPNPAYTVDMLSDNVPPLSFKQRLTELGLQITGKFIKNLCFYGFENKLYEQLFVSIIRDRRSFVPSLEILKYNASLILSNSHVSTGVSVRLPPNFISIGGYHIKSNTSPLPEALQKLMDTSKHGVIYFSMGSNLKSKYFPSEVKQDLLKMFGKLKQTVVWKFEEDLPNRPSNVHILQWAPQQSILAHKHCILFITHGGMLSTTETIHFGVPIIGIPAFGDQFVNLKRLVKKGFAQKVDLSYTMAEDLKVAIEEVLSNPRYSANAKHFSQIYHDRPVSPAKELVHWVEHVIKTQGALHLRSPAFMVPWYQKIYLDFILILLVLFVLLKNVVLFIMSKTYKLKKVKMN